MDGGHHLSPRWAVIVRRVLTVGLGVVLLITGLLDIHVQVAAIVCGVLLLSGLTVEELAALFRRPNGNRPPP